VDRPSRIRFRIAQEELGLGPVWTVTPFVDGVSLVELGGLGPFVFARSHYERALAEPEQADPAG
jgi:hypothetical protein